MKETLLILSPVYSLQSSRRCLAAGLESCNEQGWNSHQPSTHTKQAHIHTLTHIQRHAHPHTYTYTLPQIPTHPYTYTESYIFTPTYIHIYAHAHIYTPPTHTHRARALVTYHILMLTVYMCVCVYAQLPSHVWLFETPWTVACQASLLMEVSRQEYWSGLPFPPPGDLP